MRHHPIVSLLAAAALVAAAGCQSQGNAKETASDEKKPAEVPVEVATLATGPIEQTLRYSAHLEAERAVEVRSEASRRIVALLVEEGDVVAKGAALLRLEDDQQKTALERVEGQLERARWEHDRQAQLFAEKMLSEQDMTRVRHDLAQLELALADARRELSYTVVRAPIAGTVTARLVRAGDRVSPNQHLFDIVDLDSLVALVYVPERELPRVGVGQAARLTPPAAPDVRYLGSIDRVSPVVDPKSGTVKVTVRVPYATGIRPGMFLEVELVTAVESAALLVPKRALVQDGTLLSVWRLKDDVTVERVAVESVLEDRERITVAAGLAAGDRVVVAGMAGLKQGAKVRLLGAGDDAR
ncbi:MAG: efflux RND transporter periplasmic adaptor subunit [Thermoanaerobaculia bacterium]|nr:efflux RND transporter periplasmic adaptor subunit [Thermoanaerobaculia bacterium]